MSFELGCHASRRRRCSIRIGHQPDFRISTADNCSSADMLVTRVSLGVTKHQDWLLTLNVTLWTSQHKLSHFDDSFCITNRTRMTRRVLLQILRYSALLVDE